MAMGGSLITKFADALPLALQQPWLRETWSGVHGSRAFDAHVDQTSVYVKVAEDDITGTASIQGSLSDGTEHAGSFARDVRLHGARCQYDGCRGTGHVPGSLEVEHGSFMVATDKQRTGAASSVNARAFERYADAGVDFAWVTAAKSTGGLAWARDFELTSYGATAQERLENRATMIGTMFVRRQQGRNGALSAEDDATLRPLLRMPREAFREGMITSLAQLADIPAGRRLLLGSQWVGRREFERTAPWYGPLGIGSDDIRNGASYLTDPALLRQRTTEAASSLMGRLPAPFRPTAVEEELSREFGDAVVMRGRPVTTAMLSGDEVMLRRDALTIDLGDAQVHDEIDWRGGPLTSKLRVTGPGASDATTRAVQAAWERLGVTPTST